jgi:hypothetical protein
MVRSREHGNEPSDTVKYLEFIDYLNNYKLVKKYMIVDQFHSYPILTVYFCNKRINVVLPLPNFQQVLSSNLGKFEE